MAQDLAEMTFEAEDIELKRHLALATRAYHRHMQSLDTNQALHTLRSFIGDRVNNAYLEHIKSVLNAQPADERRLRAIAETLREVVATSLGLLLPFLPQLCTFLQDSLALDAQAAATRALHDAMEYEKQQKTVDEGKEGEKLEGEEQRTTEKERREFA
ncbi:hypothetical protein niasHT_034001 [Heterodera trifolii]|uniref:Methionyl/Valyl/Leucyl/Isoleucyl-tRNA synthetase anticodon-binding domain-containing protein n=1 Tax=Heterodera trifolii TaxID=157864 RepID=A0ABD2IWV2_9BILA